MTPTADIPLKEPTVSAAAGDAEQLERARIDASTRVPVLMFYASAMAWLLIGTLLAGFVSFKLHSPDWLSDVSFLTWGRLRPVQMNVMIYGWAIRFTSRNGICSARSFGSHGSTPPPKQCCSSCRCKA